MLISYSSDFWLYHQECNSCTKPFPVAQIKHRTGKVHPQLQTQAVEGSEEHSMLTELPQNSSNSHPFRGSYQDQHCPAWARCMPANAVFFTSEESKATPHQ